MKNGISVVIPVYNEEQSIAESYQEVSQVLSGLRCPYEILYIDDGSSDNTVETLRNCAGNDAHLKVIQFRRNFGQTAAMAAGLDHSMYSIIVTLDGDLQNDPREIPKMIKKLEEGYDLVAGWRANRQDKFVSRKLPSMMANWLISKSTKVKLHDYGCTLKVMTADVAKGIKLYGEMHRFIPALADQVGARIAEVPVNHRARKYGQSKYGISRTIRVILDLITVKFLLGYAKRPIHFFGTAGVVTTGVGSLLIAWMAYQRFFEHVPMGSRPLLSLSVMLIILGMQFVCFGLLAEVLARTYYESQNKPIYVVRSIIQGKESQGKVVGA